MQENLHYVKSVRIRSYSGLHFPVFGLNAERYGVALRVQSEWGKTRTRITPNTDTFPQCFKLFSFFEQYRLLVNRNELSTFKNWLNIM